MVKKRILNVCFAFVLAFIFCMVFGNGVSAASEKQWNGFTYEYNETFHGMELTEYTGTAKTVNIPAEIDGMPVTAIGDWCFKYKKEVREIILPDTVTYVGNWVFSGSDIEKITLSGSLKSIGMCSFYNCRKLKAIFIPDSVESMGEAAFSYCDSLEKVVLSDRLTEIPEEAFCECRKLKWIKLPSQLKTIGESVFLRCKSLTEITLPASVKVIKYAALSNCTKLRRVVIPSNSKLKKIEACTFGNCKKLKTITLPASIETLQKCAFSNSYFEKISFDKNAKIKKIPDDCFVGCPDLEEIDIPPNVTVIGSYLFNYETCKVKKINIMGGKIKRIGVNAFDGIDEKATISVPSKYKTKYTKLFQKQSWYQPTMKIK